MPKKDQKGSGRKGSVDFDFSKLTAGGRWKIGDEIGGPQTYRDVARLLNEFPNYHKNYKIIRTYFGDLILEELAKKLWGKRSKRAHNPDALTALLADVKRHSDKYSSDVDNVIQDLVRDLTEEEITNRLGERLINAAMHGNLQETAQIMEYGGDVNFAAPDTGFTALHYAAAHEARWVLKALIKSHDLDYLIKDFKGRLPSALAFEVAENPVIGTFLMKKEIQQARVFGIDYRALIAGEIE